MQLLPQPDLHQVQTQRLGVEKRRSDPPRVLGPPLTQNFPFARRLPLVLERAGVETPRRFVVLSVERDFGVTDRNDSTKLNWFIHFRVYSTFWFVPVTAR